MAWIISKAMMNLYENSHCSQEPGAESLEENSLDGKQSVPSKTNPTQQVYLSQDKMKAFSRLSRFGMMSEPLMEDRGKDLLMWYQEDFLARTSPVQEKEKDWKEQEVDSGLNFSESSMKYNLDLFSSKIPPFCVQEDLMLFSKDLPKAGTMLRGECYQRQTVVPIINEKECGLLESWPTPTTAEVCKIPARANYGQKGLNNHPRIRGEVTREKGTKSGKQTGGKKTQQTYQTPTAMEGADCGSKWENLAKLDKGGRIQRRMATQQTVETLETERAQLNPTWVEWLMAWPLGWTDLKPLETDKFHWWLQSLSNNSTKS